MSKFRNISFLFFITFVSLFMVHKYIFNSYLQHGVVEDGSVSQYTGDLLDQRSIKEKYEAILQCDGQANGRYRPAYFAYEALPFIITVVNNFGSEIVLSTSEIRKRINGDVRLHMIFLASTIALSIFVGSLVVYFRGRSVVYASFFSLAVLFSPTLVRNITYNDTAEVPQLLWFSLYMALFVLSEYHAKHGKMFKLLITLLLSCLVCALLYLTKETSVVLMPALVVYVCLYYFCGMGSKLLNKKTTFLTHCFQVIFNIILCVWVLYNVRQLRAGYATHYKIVSLEQVWKTLLSYRDILVQFPPTIWYPLLSLIICLMVLIWGKFRNIKLEESFRFKENTLFAVLLISVGVGLLILNLPWEFVGERYMLPTVYFLSMAGCVLIATLQQSFLSNKLVLQVFFAVCLICVPMHDAVSEYKRIQVSYENEYGANRSVINIAELIQKEGQARGRQCTVLLDVGKMSPYMWIQLARVLNIEYKMNVAIPGMTFPLERLYLKEYKDKPYIAISPSDGDGYTNAFDLVISSIPHNQIGMDIKQKKLDPLLEYYEQIGGWAVIVNGNNIFDVYVFRKRQKYY